jgi:DNA-binding MarR family transcriptional regulator
VTVDRDPPGDAEVTVDRDPPRDAEVTLDGDPLGDAELTFLLGTAFQVVLAEFVRRLNAAGYSELRPAHGMIFQILAGSGATSTELAERLGVTKQAAGQMVTELEKRGYVRREMHPEGGRRRLVVLTDKALGHLAVAGRILHDLEAELAAQVNDTNLAVLRSELSRLVHAMVGDAIPPLRPIW